MLRRLLFLGSLWASCSLAGAAGAQEEEAEAEEFVDPLTAAQRASEAHAALCASTASSNEGLAADAMVEVSSIWGDLRKARAVGDAPFLAYWDGMLAQCLRQEKAAVQAFRDLVALAGDLPEYKPMVDEAQTRLRRLGDEQGSDEEAVDELKEDLGKRVWKTHCRKSKTKEPLGPQELQEVSGAWGALVRIEEPNPNELLWTGRLALCLGQLEAAEKDLARWLKQSGASRTERAVLLELQDSGIYLTPEGERLPEGRLARRTFASKPRGEFWVGGGALMGGVRQTSRLYAGLDLEQLANGDPWYSSESRNSDGRTVPAMQIFNETSPSMGVTGGFALGLRRWEEVEPGSKKAQFGFGFVLAGRFEQIALETWTANADLLCLSRDQFGFCTSSRFGGVSWGDEGEQVDQRLLFRLLFGAEFSFRFLPERLVTPTLHFVFPAVDFTPSQPTVYCARSESDPESADGETWETARVSGWVQDDSQPLAPPFPVAGRWGVNDDDRACAAALATPPNLALSAGISLEVRPKPFFSASVRVDVQPILTWDATTPVYEWPGGEDPEPIVEAVHTEARTRVRDDAPPRAPIIGSFRLQAGFSF